MATSQVFRTGVRVSTTPLNAHPQGGAMALVYGQHKPTRKLALGTDEALVVFVLYVVFLAAVWGFFGPGAPSLMFAVTLLVIIAIPLFRAYVYPREPAPPRGRRLELHDGKLRQLDGDVVVASIDVMRPFEYEVLDSYYARDSLFRLHQAKGTLTFYNSDPGGEDAVRDVLQLTWPPPTVGASWSIGPSIEDGDIR